MNDSLSAGDICKRDVTVASPSMPLDQAARLMRRNHVGCLVVVGERSPCGMVPIGVLTDRDIVTAVIANDQDARLLHVGDVMSVDIVAVNEDESVIGLLAAMRRRGVRRVPVTDAAGALVGIAALDDVLGLLADEMLGVVAAIAAGSRRERAFRA
jgi:CBS domain-containing protein